MRCAAIVAAALGTTLCCAGQSGDSAKEILTAAVAHDSAGREVTAIDSIPSQAYPGGRLYVAELEPKSPHAASSVVAFRDKSGTLSLIGHLRMLPGSWPTWDDQISESGFLPACEELVGYFVLGEPRGVLRVNRAEAIPFFSAADGERLSQLVYAVTDSGSHDLSYRHVEFTGYRDGDLYRLTCTFRIGRPPQVSARLLAEQIGGVRPLLTRPPLRDLVKH